MHAGKAAIAHDDDVIAGSRATTHGLDEGVDFVVRLHA